ncbi:MAG: hypothetical protein WC792_00490 [Candidatus Micrarchaeia archaeon]|jgi:hypothetical protein
MATDGEIIQLWKSLPEKTRNTEGAIKIYRLAEDAGRNEGISAFEKELSSDATIETALKTFGWGSRFKGSLITLRAVLKEAGRLAREKAGKSK